MSELIDAVAAKIEKTGIAEHDAPFTYKGFRYVTNGHIAVRVKSDGEDSAGSFPAKVASIFDKEYPDGSFIAPPEIPYSADDLQCTTCLGTGKVKRIKCDECGGEGELECDLGHMHNCYACDGSGGFKSDGKHGEEILCDGCNGIGVKRYAPVHIGASAIDARYLQVIRSLPGAEIMQPTDRDSAIPFRFHSGDGLVMPIRTERGER